MTIKSLEKVLEKEVKIKSIQVCNFENVKNQFVISIRTTDNDYVEILQSYNSIVVMRKGTKIYLFRDWDYSRTTVKYVCRFLGVESKKEIIKKLKSKEYIAVDFDIN